MPTDMSAAELRRIKEALELELKMDPPTDSREYRRLLNEIESMDSLLAMKVMDEEDIDL